MSPRGFKLAGPLPEALWARYKCWPPFGSSIHRNDEGCPLAYISQIEHIWLKCDVLTSKLNSSSSMSLREFKLARPLPEALWAQYKCWPPFGSSIHKNDEGCPFACISQIEHIR